MRRAAVLPVLLVVAGAACGGSTPSAKDPSGGAAEKPAETGNSGDRPLTHDECQQLGESIIDTCHNTHTRMATIEGWCGDVIAGVSSGAWVADCEKHIRYSDSMCFSSADNSKSMMDCDAAVSR